MTGESSQARHPCPSLAQNSACNLIHHNDCKYKKPSSSPSSLVASSTSSRKQSRRRHSGRTCTPPLSGSFLDKLSPLIPNCLTFGLLVERMM
ncbi:hypothetical protein LINGRAHAP2_LOCUS20679, partial [Linum grandiflorum]